MTTKILKSPQAVIGLVIIAVVLIAAILAPVFAPNDPEKIDIMLKFGAANEQYPMGNDALGRCVLSRLLYGARYSMGVSLPILSLRSMRPSSVRN